MSQWGHALLGPVKYVIKTMAAKGGYIDVMFSGPSPGCWIRYWSVKQLECRVSKIELDQITLVHQVLGFSAERYVLEIPRRNNNLVNLIISQRQPANNCFIRQVNGIWRDKLLYNLQERIQDSPE